MSKIVHSLLVSFFLVFAANTSAHSPKENYIPGAILPHNNLLSFYKMEGNALDSTSENDGYFVNGPLALTANRHGQPNSALVFNGTNQYIATSNLYTGPNSFTISIWFKTNSAKGGALIGFSSKATGDGGSRDRFIYMNKSGNLYFGAAPNRTKSYLKSPNTYADNLWHLATATIGSGGMKLYVDGALVASNTTKSAESYSGYWRIGHDDLDTWPEQPSTFYFQGALDDAAIYTRELAADEVKSLFSPLDVTATSIFTCPGESKGSISVSASGGQAAYTYSLNGGTFSNSSTFTNLAAGTYNITAKDINGKLGYATATVSATVIDVPQENLIGQYPLDGNAVDVTGINNGSLYGSPTFDTDRFNLASKALRFNGTAMQYVSTTKSYANPANFTISIWFKTNSTQGGRLIGFGSSKTGGSSNYDRHIYMTNDGKLHFGVYPGEAITIFTAGSYNDDNWHHVVATLSDETGMKLYVDGQLQASKTTTRAGQNYSGYWRIGYDKTSGWPSSPTSSYFNGKVDEAMIYTRAIEFAEVDKLYKGSTGATNNGPVCAGSTLTLSATPIAGATYSWVGPNGFTASGASVTRQFAAGMSGIYTATISSNGCNLTVATTVEGKSNPGQWTGNVSDDWNTANNWCDGVVPGSTTDVTISAGVVRMPVVNGVANVKNLTILTGATLTTAAPGNLVITGSLSNSGSMINGGTTTFNGAGVQTFSGIVKFNHVVIGSTSSITLPESIEVNSLTLQGNASLKAGSFDIDVKGNWTNNATTTSFNGGTGKVTFTGNQPQNIGGSTVTTFYTIYASNVGNVLSLSANISVKNILVVGGVFDIATFDANGSSASTLYMSEKGVLRIGGVKGYPAGYNTYTFLPASTVEYYGGNQPVGAFNYGNLIINGTTGTVTKSVSGVWGTQGSLTIEKGTATSVSFTANANHTISGDAVIENGATFNGGSSTTTVSGDWNNNGVFNGNTGTVVLKGATTQVAGTGTNNFNHLTIEGAGVTFGNQNIKLSGNLATVNSGSFVQAETGTLTMTGSSVTITGAGITLGNLVANGETTINNSLNVLGNLAVSGTGKLRVPAATLAMTGTAKTITGEGLFEFRNLNIKGSVTVNSNFSILEMLNVEGSMTATANTATFKNSSSLSGTANLYNVTINGTKLILSANSVLGISSAFTITSGMFDVTTSIPNTVHYNGKKQNIVATEYYHLKLEGGNKIALGAIKVFGDIDIAPAATFTAKSYTHQIYGNWINAGTFSTAATGTISFKGSNNSSITGATTFNNLTIDRTSKSVSLFLNDNVTSTNVIMTSGNIQTGSKSLTIKATRTGPGIIMGNIIREHTFVINTDYAFEGPDNIIRFTAATGISKIALSVVKKEVTDFPGQAAIGREYNIAVTGTSYTGNLRLHYENNELNGANESELDMWRTTVGGWAGVGKTVFDTARNYVEQTGFTSSASGLNGGWTLSAATSEFVWKGTVSSDWHTPANWKTSSGTATRVPNAYDIVKIGVETFNHQPVITAAATAQNVVFGSDKEAILALNSGSLTTATVKGTWNKAATHQINVGAGASMVLTGDLILSNGTPGQRINLSVGNGQALVYGTVTQTADAEVSFGAGMLRIGEDYLYSGGTFTRGTGTVVYAGIENQIVASVPYFNLEIEKPSGQASILTPATIHHNLQVSGELQTHAEVFVNGDVGIAVNGKLVNKNIIHVKGDWRNNGVFEGQGIKVVFDGAGLQTIFKTTFNHLEINKPVGSMVELAGNVILKGSLWGTSGALDIKNYEFNRDIKGGTAYLSNNATLILGGATAPRNFANYNFEPNSTVIFNGEIAQNLLMSGLQYGNLIFRNSGLKTIEGSLTVQGDFTIETGASVAAEDVDLVLKGNWQNSGNFLPGVSTVHWNGSDKMINGVTTFHKVVVAGKYTVNNNLTFNNYLNIEETAIVTSPANVNYTMHGDFRNSGSLTILGEGIFTGTQKQTLRLMNAVKTEVRTITFNGTVSPELISTSQPTFGILNVNNTGGITTSVGWSILSQLNIGVGASFNGGTFTHNFYGNMENEGVVTSAGKINFIPASNALLNFGTDFESSGTVVLGGAGAITIAGMPKKLTNVLIENKNTTGISPASDWTILGDLTIKKGSTLKAAAHHYKIKGDLHDSGVINAGTSTFTFDGASLQELQTLSALNHVIIENTGSYVQLLSELQVAGQLKFVSGKIYTGDERVTVLASGSVTNAGSGTGWVYGNLNKYFGVGTSNQIFEIGDEAYYAPVNIHANEVSAAGNLLGKTVPVDHPEIDNSTINSEKSVNRYYSFSSDDIALANYNATFHFVADDLDAGANPLTFGVGRYNGSSWSVPEVTEVAANSIKATGLVKFGQFAIGEICFMGTSIQYPSDILCTSEGTVEIIAAGTSGGVFSADEGLAINPATGALDLQNSTPGSYTVTYELAATAGCNAFISKAQVKVGVKGLWIGTVGSDWNDDNNWSCKVPLLADDVTIPAGASYYPVITGENGVHHLTLLENATLTVEGLFKVSGDIMNSGELDFAKGTLEMSGTTPQSIPALKDYALKNLMISNTSSAGVNLADKLEVFGGIAFSGQGKKLETGNQLTLRSTSSGTAWVGDLTGNTINGDVTVERYLSPHKAWRLLSIPTATEQDVKTSWMENGVANNDPQPGYGVQVTSERSTWQAEGFDLYSRGGPSMKGYNAVTNKWVGITSTYNKINTDRGYMIFVRGNRASNAFNSPVTETVLRTTGPLKRGDQARIATLPNTYTLIGNPYAAPIDFTKIEKGDGVDNAFYLWDPFIAGSYNLGGYQTFSAANGYVPVPGGSAYAEGSKGKLIASGLAFFVHSSVDDGSGKNFDMQLKESAKESAAAGGGPAARSMMSRGGAERRGFMRATLITGGGVIADGNAVAFDAAFSNEVDGDDAVKLAAEGENFGIKRNGKVLAVEARSRLSMRDTIYYHLTNLAKSNYQLLFAPAQMEAYGTQAYLWDKHLQKTTPVSLYDTTYVQISVTTDPGSFATDRLALIFWPMTPLPVTVTSIEAVANKSDVAVTWKVENESGMQKYELERSYNGEDYEKVYGVAAVNQSSAQYQFVDKGNRGNAFYRVRITNMEGRVSFTEVVKVYMGAAKSGVEVYPNPVENGVINLYVNAAKGKVQVRLLNELGQCVMQKEVDHKGGASHEVISVDGRITRGVYHLQVKGAEIEEVIKLKL